MHSPNTCTAKIWRRAFVPSVPAPDPNNPYLVFNDTRVPAWFDLHFGQLVPEWPECVACRRRHPVGSCPLKLAGVELCPLCALPHFGFARVCPHIKSETMVRLMLETLRQSPEPRELVEAAAKYLKGVKGHLVANKRKARELLEARAAAAAAGLAVGQTVAGTSQQPGAVGQQQPPRALQPPGVEERPLQAWKQVGPLMP
jgi:Chromatin remodeling factor Mit1 C-terminal Zn finger 2